MSATGKGDTAALAHQVREWGLSIATDGLAALAVDGRTPALAVAPASSDGVAAVIGMAAQAEVAIAPRGGGTKVGLGNPLHRYGLALQLGRLDRVLEYEPADLTVTVQAATRLSVLQERLAQAGQFLALDPPHGAQATIGGILATNASGPSRLMYGSARDLVLGMRFATADGQIAKAGGKVVKNVVGYDLNKMHIGALGTLGVMVEVTLKVAPLPSREATLWARFPALAEAHGFAGRLFRSQLGPRAVELLDAAAAQSFLWKDDAPREGAWLILMHAAGSPATVSRQLGDAGQWAKSDGAVACGTLEAAEHDALWTAVREWPGRPAPGGLCLKIATLPTDLAAVWEVLDRAAASVDAKLARLAHAGSGITYALARPSDGAGSIATSAAAAITTAVMSVALPRGGSVVIESCPLELKQHLDVWGPTRDDFPLMQALKEQFDPRGILNPGRFLGRL